MDVASWRTVRWTLAVSGIVGLLCSASMFLVTQGQFGQSTTAVHILDKLPSWTQLSAAPPQDLVLLVVGFTCGLLLAIGGWPVKVCAALVVAWFVYAQAAFGTGSHWWRQAGETFDYTPLRVGALVSVSVLLAASILALVIALRGRGVARATMGAAHTLGAPSGEA